MHSGPLILGGKCWNPALSESCLGLFNGNVWTAQKNCSPLRNHFEVFHAVHMEVSIKHKYPAKCRVIKPFTLHS